MTVDHTEIKNTIDRLMARKDPESSFRARQLLFATLPPSYFVENYLYDNEGRPQALTKFPMLRQIYDNLPQKLILKCSRKTLKSTLLSNMLCLNLIRYNYYKMMYVGPQETSTKYFSQNYLPPRFESPKIKKLLRKGWFKNDVFEKQLEDTKSGILFRYVSDDASRTRGPAVEQLLIDECILFNTKVLSINEGVREVPVLDLKPGDDILAFNEHRDIKPDRIKQIVYKGLRPVWTITLSNGRSLTCTSNERILTPGGWVYLAWLLPDEEANRCARARQAKTLLTEARATRTGDIAGGWLYPRNNAQALHSKSRSQTGGLCTATGTHPPELHKHTSTLKTKRGVWNLECPVFNSDEPGISVCIRPMLQDAAGWNPKETSNPGVARQTNLGRNSLLVHGRRKSRNLFTNPPHRRLHEGRKRVASCLANLQVKCSGDNQSVQRVLSGDAKRRGLKGLGGAHQTLCYPQLAIQTGNNRKENMPGLWRANQKRTRFALSCLSTCIQEGTKGRDTSKKLKQAGVCSGTKSSRQDKQGETQGGPGALCKTSSLLERDRRETAGRSSMAREEEQTRAGTPGTIEAAEIISIEYIGKQPVYDIETEKYHTFFANGFAVHNCQDIQYDQLPIIMETMAMSNIKREYYAGTPLDSTNTIHRVWRESTQNEWYMKCSHCGHWNSLTEGNDPMSMIQPHGLSCSKCLKQLDSRNGEWVKTNLVKPTLDGYHLAQPILPHFNEDPKEWKEIYQKAHGQRYEPRTVMNELFGITYDIGSKPITKEELIRVCTLGPQYGPYGEADLAVLNAGKSRYVRYAMGVDWGVSMAQSRTVATLIGMRTDGIAEVILAKVFRGLDHEAHIRQIADIANGVNAFCVSDSGPDPIRGIKLAELRGPAQARLAAYRRTKMIQSFDAGTYDWRQARWVLHRSDVISLVIRQVKAGKVLFPRWEDVHEYMEDLMNVFVEVKDGMFGQELVYDHHPKQPDDAMHSLVFALCAGYYLLNDVCLQGPSTTAGDDVSGNHGILN